MMRCRDEKINYYTGCFYMSIQIPGKYDSILKPNAWIMAAAMNQVDIFKIWRQYPHLHPTTDEVSSNELDDMSRQLSSYSILNTAIKYRSKECFEYFITNFHPRQIGYNARTIVETALWNYELLIKLVEYQGMAMMEENSRVCAILLYRMCENLRDESMIHAVEFVLSKVEVRKKINTIFNHMTPLIYLAYYEHIDEDLAIKMSEVLLRNGQDYKIRRNEKNALEIAQWRNRNKLAEFLETHMRFEETKEASYAVTNLLKECDLKDKKIKDLETEKKNWKAEKEQNLCVICCEREKSYINTSCYHLCICEICVTKTQGKCPICRQVGKYHKTF